VFYYCFIEVFYRIDKADGSNYILGENGKGMVKRFVLLSLAVATLVIMVGFATMSPNNQSLACLACEGEGGGVVDKMPCEAFVAKISFKNTGKSEETWSINIAFEGEKWTWSGTPQTLTLKPCKTKTLTWNGSVPCEAQIDSVARLVVYYNDSFTSLNWWIHVVSGAELTITSSTLQ
jgi:hypothetical protein